MKNEELLNATKKKDIKKPLIIGAGFFLIFIIGVIIFAINQEQNSTPNDIIPPDNVENTNTQFKPLMVESADKVEEVKPQIKEPIQENKKETPQQTTPKVKLEVKEKPKPTESKPVVKANLYIQVAALIKNAKPNQKFLELIRKNGFEYKFYTTYLKKGNEKIKVTKILIGPFKKREEALKVLKKVRESINQGAFIFKVNE